MMKRIMLLVAALMLLTLAGCAKDDYDKATQLLNDGKYSEAAAIFADLGDYEDSLEQYKACRYGIGADLYNAGDYVAAKEIFAELGDYGPCASLVVQCDYLEAKKLLEA